MNYAIVYSDIADADHDRLYLAQSRRSPDQARLWDDALEIAVAGLAEFPGPRAWAIDEAASALYGREVRRLLYYGPTRRRTTVAARILFTVLPAGPEDPEPEEVILILRLLHGSQSLEAVDPPAE